MTTVALMLVLLPAARGHGGEDHGPPAPPVAAAADDRRVATWSSEFEAVLSMPYAAPGAEAHATLLLADFGTSAPVSAGEATLALKGAGQVDLALKPGQQAGIWPFSLRMPADGEYSGGLTVMTPDRADMLGIPAFRYEPPLALEPAGGAGRGLIAAVGAAGIVAGGIAGLLAGVVLGRWTRRAVAAVLVLALLMASERRVRAHGGEDHGPPPAPTAATTGGGLGLPLDSQFLLGVRTARAAEDAFAEHVRALGQAVPSPGSGAELHAPVTGLLETPAGVTPGAIVRAGQTVAVIREQLGGAERSNVVGGRTDALVRLAEARKSLALAERDAARSRELEGVLSERERLEREQALALAQESVRQAEAAAGALGGSGAPTTVLTAPIGGRVSALLARPGDVVSAGDVLLRIVGEGGSWVEARVPEALAGRLVQGSEATVVADARPDEPLVGRVLDPGLEADPRTGTLRVTIALEPVPWLKPGMTTSASIVSGTPRQALVVPDAAVVDSGGESLVFVKTAPERFEVRPIRLGALAADRREVLAGLSPGERVVVEGTYSLRSLAGR